MLVSLGPRFSIVTAADYLPSGPLASLTLGNGVTETRGFDGRYVPTQIALSGALDLTWDYTTDPVGNIHAITRSGTSCLEPPLVIDDQTLTGTQVLETCALVQGGPNTVVATGADITFRSGDRVELHDDFTVEDGALFTAEADPSITGGGEVTKTYQYRDFQYFLTQADGPWGSLSWSYDKIGNRLTETRDGTTDTYNYTPAGSPILDSISLGVGGTADYTWDLAGNLDSIDRSGNLIDFTFDDASRMSSVSRPAASETTTFTYDGRSFLKSADQTAGGTGFANPVYSSEGVLHKLTRQDDGAGTSEEIFYLYLAGRPVAQFLIESSSETYSFLTTDHLGGPLLATDEAGAVTWAGGFEPFGPDWQAQTASSALSADLLLRLPGQWDDPTWEDASLGAPLYYNVHRWYEYGTGRYTRVDPIGLRGGMNVLVYSGSDPINASDEQGLAYFAKRPLWRLPWLGPLSCNSLDDRTNTELSHEQLFFEDGKKPSNIGFGDDGLFRELNPTGYRCRSRQYNDCIMRKAVENVGTPKPYCLLGKPGPTRKYNCQDWSDQVRKEYRNLLQKPETRKECCPSE